MEQNKKLTLTTNPLECEGNDEVATIWKDQKEGACLIASLSRSPGYEEGKEFGKQLVCAYNSTYGASINPEAVPNLLESLNVLIERYSDMIISEFSADPDDHPDIHAAKAAIEKAKL